MINFVRSRCHCVARTSSGDDARGTVSQSQHGSGCAASRTAVNLAAHRANSTASQIDEHRRLFSGFHRQGTRFEPPKAVRRKGKGKYVANASRRSGRSVWKKSTICLRDKDQVCKPSAEEKMVLAKMGLGLAELVFDFDGDAEHIHFVLLGQFPHLETCGGYALMRLKENSYDLVEIEYPAKGLTVSYLKDILNQAKLYVRPLQRSILEEILHKVASYEASYGQLKCVCHIASCILAYDIATYS